MLKTYLMMSSAVKTCVMLLAIVLLAACGSTPKQSGTATTNEYSDAEYNNKVTKFINNPEAGKVEPLFKAYVNSTIPDNIWDIRNDFDALQARINNGESCARTHAQEGWGRFLDKRRTPWDRVATGHNPSKHLPGIHFWMVPNARPDRVAT